MEADNSTRQYVVKGGKTFLGAMFAYQERTGMTPKEILKLPYIQFVIGMVDCPQVDYESKNKKEETNVPRTVEEEITALTRALR